MNNEPRWMTKAKETYNYHRGKLLANEKWTASQTAKLLRRSIGSINEDLQIARACKEHEEKLKRFDYAYQAINWIRERKQKEDLEVI